jgi:chemotaxis protein CheD
MARPDPNPREVYLKPGEMFLAREPTTIRTILGSCVGVTFWCARLRVGALCHSMLPRCPRPAHGAETTPEIGFRYVDFCVREIARQFDRLGAARHEVQVKVFGGADVLFVDEAAARPSVGRLNYETAIEVLREEGFAVSASSLGETFGRKIRFDTGSGEVMLLRLT